MKKIMIASPINKPPQILEKFFQSLNFLKSENYNIEYLFVDDNDCEESSKIIYDFMSKKNGDIVKSKEHDKNSLWEKSEHFWTSKKIQKVAYYKNEIIKKFLETKNEYLFFIDSDLVLHPNTLENLLKDDKDIVANIFWTKWQEQGNEYPQVWLKDFYTLYDDHMLRPLTQEQRINEEKNFLEKLKTPGVYKVGGLGACTLIKRNVFEKGVHFGDIYNLSFWGEDRSFCVRAVALGFELYVDTINPAFHMFREHEISKAQNLLEIYKDL